jgi:hypothetical protein
MHQGRAVPLPRVRRPWSNNTVRVLARDFSGSTFDLGAGTLSVAVTKRRIP